MVADVPVSISFIHGEELLDEYEDIISVEFNNNTPEGRMNLGKINLLRFDQRLSTESALFTLASEAVHAHAQETIAKLGVAVKIAPGSKHEIHLHVRRNGEITYRGLLKGRS